MRQTLGLFSWLFVLIMAVMTGCTELSNDEGIDRQFKKEATAIFLELDEMVEQFEEPNFEIFEKYDTKFGELSPEEEEVIQLLATMFEVGTKWHEDPNSTNIEEYLYARERIANLLDIKVGRFQDTGVDAD